MRSRVRSGSNAGEVEDGFHVLKFGYDDVKLQGIIKLQICAQQNSGMAQKLI
jgi:hypothetical protein